MKTQPRIGITSKNYASKRLILHKIEGAKYVDVRFYNQYFWKNIHLWFFRHFKILRMSPENMFIKLFLRFKIVFPGLFRISLFHFFNTINCSNKSPWVLSIETCVPFSREIVASIQHKTPDFTFLKDDESAKIVLDYLASDSCKGLLTLSDCSKAIQTEILNVFPEYGDKIRKKLVTLHPPQDLLVKDLEDKQVSYEQNALIRFIFVGRDFFRKGGKQILQAFDQYRNQKNFELIIISDLKSGNEDFSFFSKQDSDDCNCYIQENSDWIKYYPSKPNHEVLELIKKSHVALLPTWMDTYGYSVLECQASGCPVITTNLRALREINNVEVGWVVEVPTNVLNHPAYANQKEFDLFAETLRNGLISVLGSIFNDRNSIAQKANGSLKRIRTYHNVTDYSRTLERVYRGELV